VPSKPRKKASRPQRPREAPAESPAWRTLFEQFPDRQGLQDETIYALPLRLIDAISFNAPDFFTEDDRGFERALRQSAGDGFFMRRPFTCLMLKTAFDQCEAPVPRELAERHDALKQRHAETDGKLREMISDYMRKDGRTEKEIDSYFAAARADSNKLDPIRAGYAGWLATDSVFCGERDQIRERWRDRVDADGCFPEFPRSLMWENPAPVPRTDREFHSEFMLFYRRWGLESFVTWEIPAPMRWEMASPSFHHLGSVHDAGALVFVPWYLLRNRSLTLYDLLEQKRLFPGMSHLTEWLDGNPPNWGIERYAAMLRLYVFLELALKNRYCERLKRNTNRLDIAFARYFYDESKPMDADRRADAVRKTRQELHRRLPKHHSKG
jgi:hypothetical protein